MRPLPPVDELELVQAHALVDELVLRDLLVLGEGVVPIRLGEWRNDAEQRLPLGDRQAGIREPSRAADDDHGEHESRHGIEPQPHGTELIFPVWRDHSLPRLLRLWHVSIFPENERMLSVKGAARGGQCAETARRVTWGLGKGTAS